MDQEEHQFTNRLINEKSPYLLQHAHNPVDWYPWGDDAFVAAKEQSKPIFLSIGYATCHWCHVMEFESFDDPEVADALNKAFICVKVDREEHPEIDSLYMEFAQTMIVGSAGWPLNIILTPELKPFFAATYLPKESSRGLVGIIELTEKISELWKSDEQERILSQAEKIVDILKSHVHVHGKEMLSEAPITQTAEILFRIADPIWGGMRGAPKFPLGYQANFLLRYYQRTQDARAIFLVEKTLEMMHRGGIYDHLGGGFHRYSVDEHWHIPHFEKMLYDNAILSYSYLEAGKVTNRPTYKKISRHVLDYIARDMRHKDGAFFSAEDADTDGIEGLYYSWTRQEALSFLGEAEGTLFCDFYGIFDHGILDGRSVMHETSSVDEFCNMRALDLQETQKTLEKGKEILFKERERRLKPFRDEKIICSWNGLMIHAFAEAGFQLQNRSYSDIAVKAASFIKDTLWQDEHLMRRFCDGETRFFASLDDYAFLIRALLSLFETGQSVSWLNWAIELCDQASDEFKAEEGAYYQASENEEHLLIRKCQFSDGAEPSGNAVMAENLIRLYQITGNRHYKMLAEDIFRAAKRFIDTYPLGYCYHLLALERYYDKKKATLVIALNDQEEGRHEIEEALSKLQSPHHAIVWCKTGETGEHVKPAMQNQTTLYICHEGVCLAPVTNKEAILKAINAL